MQETQFHTKSSSLETHDQRIYRLNHKWLIESEIWLTSLLIIELLYGLII